MTVPPNPKIYHIVHLDRLPWILATRRLLCDAEVQTRNSRDTVIGMDHIKQRRLYENVLQSHALLKVGNCVPFYFCPRSIMLYLIHCAASQELRYHGGQEPIIHLEANLRAAVAWADENDKRWAFTLSNAGSHYFEDRADLDQLNEINWEIVQTNRWSGNMVSRSIKEGKQAEFLMEQHFPWHLIERIGVASHATYIQVHQALVGEKHRPSVDICPRWYY